MAILFFCYHDDSFEAAKSDGKKRGGEKREKGGLAEEDGKQEERERGRELGEKEKNKAGGGLRSFWNWFPKETQPAQSKNKLF